MAWRTWLFGLVFCACAQGRPEPAPVPAPAPAPARAPEPAPPREASGSFVVRGGTILGRGKVDLEIRDGRVTAIGTSSADLPILDAGGRWIAPTAIDSHVHLSYLPAGRAVLAGGVTAVIDLAAPVDALAGGDAPPELLVWRSGPMITARGGYPTQGWGEDGYGLEVTNAVTAAKAVDTLVDAGAKLIKVPVDEAPALDARALRAIVERAHARGVKVAAHALLERHARLAAEVDVDVLAHTPVEPLRDATVAAWSGRAVIATLAAFGGARETVDNLRRLRAAGATVLYGTDLGNRRAPGIDAEEIALLLEAGLDGQAIVASMTSAPAAYWGLADAGALVVGGPASFLVLPRDPLQDPAALAEPDAVYVAGARLSGGT